MGKPLWLSGRIKLWLGTCAMVFLLGILSYRQEWVGGTVTPVCIGSNPSANKEAPRASSRLKSYMLYPLEMDSLPNVVSAIIEGRNPGEEPINRNYNISFATHPVSRCERPLGLLVLIKTCFQFKEKRNALRQTWANSKYLSQFDVPIEYAFILGNGIYDSNATKVEFIEEVNKEGDVIVANFVDTYRNNTYKSMAALHWSVQYCKEFEFLLMVDDDMHLSLHNAIRFLKGPYTYPTKKEQKTRGQYGLMLPGKEIFWGGFVYQEPVYPKRDPKNKWFVDWDEYPFKTFPSVVPGCAIFYSRNITRQFAIASQFVKHLNLDDVYLSLIGAKLKLKPFRMNEWILNLWNWNRNRSKGQKPNQEKNSIAAHGLESPQKLVEFWKKYEKGV